MFVKYQHIERFGTQSTEGIENGTCYVFPKIDGTNASLWVENDVLVAGSRRRVLTLDSDNAGFYAWVKNQLNIYAFFAENPDLRVYGEWLVPHSLKTYRENAWRNFYVFDVVESNLKEENCRHIPYEDYKLLLDEFGMKYIPPIKIIRNGNYEQLINQLEQNVFLIEDGKGCGEGIVIKNYDFINRYGRQIWAKIVTSEFKEKHSKEMDPPVVDGKTMPEDSIISNFCTDALIKKTYEKIKNEKDGWSSKNIPELLGRVWHDLIVEESFNFIKKLKNPTVNFRTLHFKMIIKIKETLPEKF